ncbi:guanine nucleotide-binding protein subunit gamma [Hyphococcus luteus]|nr:guanine nucleotide-binding protein subunit gamma [Marinicaulis flavus]
MSKKIKSFRDKIKTWAAKIFPERQIYHKSDSVVHLINMSTKTQAALVVITASAVVWIAYASVNVVFNEQILLTQKKEIMQLRHELADAKSKASEATCSEVFSSVSQNVTETVETPALILPLKWSYDLFVSAVDYVEPENNLTPSERLGVFAEFLKFLITGVAIGFSWAVGTFMLQGRVKKNEQ